MEQMAVLPPVPDPTRGVLRIPRPPAGSRLVGQTAHGYNLYERIIEEPVRDEQGRIVQVQLIGSDKKPIVVKDPRTGAEIRPRTRNKMRKRVQRFYIHVEANERGFATGDHTIVEYTDEMHQEVLAKGRRIEADGYSQQFFNEAAKRGIPAQELLDKIMGSQPDSQLMELNVESDTTDASAENQKFEDEGEKDEGEPETYPKRVGHGQYYLSPEHEAACLSGDDDVWRGKQADAIEAAEKLAGEQEGL